MRPDLYKFIYEYYLSKILFGRLKKGVSLPAIKEFSNQFQVAPRIGRKVLLNLQKNGYISIFPEWHSIVSYDVSEESKQLAMQTYTQSRLQALQELQHLTPLLTFPLLREGCKRLNDNDFKVLDKMILHAQMQDSYLPYLLGCIIIGKLNNKIALDLYEQITLFCRFSIPSWNHQTGASGEFKAYCETIKQLSACCKELNPQGMLEYFNKIQKLFSKIVQKDLQKHMPDSASEPLVPFTWSLHHDRSQICYSLVAKFIRAIMDGQYPPDTNLPSYADIAKKYNVSISTTRRTIRLLNELGLTQPVRGTSARISNLQPDPQNLKRLAIVKNFELVRQGIQIIRLTIPNFIEDLLHQAAAPPLGPIRERLKQQVSAGETFGLLLTCMQCLILMSPSNSLQAIYKTLYELFLWGYPLTALPAEPPPAPAMYNLIIGLEQKSKPAFSNGIQEVLCYAESLVKQAKYQ